MMHKCVALLGKRDEPTDAVEEYCRYLGDGLRATGFDLHLVHVPWAEMGWSAGLQVATPAVNITSWLCRDDAQVCRAAWETG